MKNAPDVLLTPDDRAELKKLISSGRSHARVQIRARILLLAAERSSAHSRGGDRRRSTSNKDIAAILQVHPRTVSRVRQRYVSEGLEAALHDRSRSGRPVEITGEVEAKVTMLACSAPPEGRDHWTLQLLADKMVELDYIDHLSDVAVMKVLKKTNCGLGRSRVGVSHR
jgi:transposase